MVLTNVIFEFGLFLGSGGLNRAFLFAKKTIDLPSDLVGITISEFAKEDGQHDSLNLVCEDIKKQMLRMVNASDLGFLPSTALAIGY